MVRAEGWEDRLVWVIEAARNQPYELGVHDCFRLACRSIEALTGVDRWPEFVGYTTKREALAKLAVHGSTFEDAGDWFFGGPRVRPLSARRGDICAYQTADGEKHLGVCLGAAVAVMRPEGLGFVRMDECLCAWRVC